MLRRSSLVLLLALVGALVTAALAVAAPGHLDRGGAGRHSRTALRHHRGRRVTRSRTHLRAPARAARVPGARQRPASAVTPGTTSPAAPPLVFGIYPGGASGSVGPSGPLKPEDPALRLAALQQLRAPGAPLVLHLYAGYTGPDGWTVAQQIGDQIASYTDAGFQVEIVLCYRPADGGSSADVSDFARFAGATVAQYGSNRGVVSLQVTNEANLAGAPNASDGYYQGAKDALIAGVMSARAAIDNGGDSQLKLGFNWANASDPGETAFWSYLGQHGGAAFARALDWVGLDAYPGTWGPALTGSLTTGTTSALDAAFKTLRNEYMPLAGIPAQVALHVSESGYPTGPGRTPAMQAQALTAAVNAVNAARATYNVTDYRWFDLRDANSSSQSFEDQYGLMTDTYQPKPAFAAYQNLIAQLR